MLSRLISRLLLGLAFLVPIQAWAASPSLIPGGYLSTSGNQIVSSTNANVRLACVGYSNPGTAGSYANDMTVIKNAGFNCVRIDYWDALNCPNGTCDFTNFDQYVTAATGAGIRVIFDHHGNEGAGNCLSQQENGLWYDVASSAPYNVVDGTDGCGNTGTVTYAQFKSNWLQFANHYKGNTTVIGFDLDNEPLAYGLNVTIQGNWGGHGDNNQSFTAGNGADYLAMINDVGAALQSADPGVLLIVEAMGSVGQLMNGAANPLSSGSAASDLTLAHSQPPTSVDATHLVYSVHEYPTSISSVSPDSGSGAISAYNTLWGYLVSNNYSPIWIGELAANMTSTDDTNWANTISAYVNGTAANGPTFTASQQGISTDWWEYGYTPNQQLIGICANSNCSSLNQSLYNVYSAWQYFPSGGGGGGTGPVGIKTPADLLKYLGSLKGQHTISGQFTSNNNSGGSYGGIGPINQIQSTTGKWLGAIGCDLVDFPNAIWDNSCSNYAISYWQSGGLVILQVSMPNPTTGGGSPSVSGFIPTDILTANTTTNTNFVSYLDTIASYIQVYANAGVVVIFRPFHEMNGNWFWWGTGSGGSGMTSSQFIAMWQYMHNYLVNTKGLTNIVWDYSPNGCGGGTCDTADFPGTAYTDTVGWDIYSNTPGADTVGDYNSLSAYNMPILLNEFGPGSPSCGNTSFAETTLVSQIKQYIPNSVLVQQWWSANANCPGWGMDTLTDTTSLTNALADPWIINRDGIGCSNCGGPSQPTGTTWSTTDKTPTISLSNSNNTATSTTTGGQGVRTSTSKSSGKFCAQITENTVTSNISIGISNASENLTGYLGGASSQGVGFYTQYGGGNQFYYNGGPLSNSGTAPGSGVVTTIELDAGAGLWWAKNSNMTGWNNSTTANPETGTGGIPLSGASPVAIAGPYYLEFNTQDTNSAATLVTIPTSGCTASFKTWDIPGGRAPLLVVIQ